MNVPPTHRKRARIITYPRAMLKLAQSTLLQLGGRLHAEFPNIRQVFLHAVAQTYLTGKPNFSLGGDGSGKFSGIADEEMVMEFPGEMLSEMRG